jgi:hypothetical protein
MAHIKNTFLFHLGFVKENYLALVAEFKDMNTIALLVRCYEC